MITARAFAGKHYAVLGLARSGLATVEALLASGARVTAWDDKVIRERRERSWRVSAAMRRHPSAAAMVPRPAPGRLKSPTSLEADLTQFNSIVVTPGLPLNRHPIAQRAREAGVEIIGDIELFARARAELPPHKVVGITGTNGKSTTTALIHHILQTAGVPSLMGGNIGLPILAQDPLPEGGVYVLELSSYQLDLTQSLDCDVAVLLNITPDHLDRYESFEAYAASKARLFEMQSPGMLAIVDDRSRGRTTDVLLNAEDPDRSSVLSTTIEVWRPVRRLASAPRPAQSSKMQRPPLPPASAWAWTTKQLSEALRTYPGLPHRMERVAREGRRPVRQRQQGDQPDRDRAGAGGVPEDPLDPRRAGQDRQSRRMRAAFRACAQGLYHWRSGRNVRVASCPRTWPWQSA